MLGAATPAHARVNPPARIAAKRRISSTESHIRFTSKTIQIPRATVKRNLLGVAPDGTFKFRHAAGPLAQLKRGKVMLLQGADAVRVTSVQHRHATLLVHTKAATISDVVASGKIAFSGAPDVHGAALKQLVVPVGAKASAFAPPAYPYVDRRTDDAAALLAGAPTLSANGSSGPFGYSLSFTPASATRLDLSGTLCFINASNCANGKSNGVSAEVTLGGYVDIGNAAGSISIGAGGVVGSSSLSIRHLAAHLHVEYTVKHGQGSTGNEDPPLFRVPVSVDYTVPGEIPLYLKLQGSLLLKLGVEAKNAAIHGGFDLDTAGSQTVSQHGKSVSGSESGDTSQGTILSHSDGGVPPSVSLSPAGVIIGVAFPKIGVGLGFTSANAIAYVEIANTVGQTTGALAGGQLCSAYEWYTSIKGGLEAQVGLGKFGLDLASAPKVLYEPPNQPFKLAEPGCTIPKS